ncbi:MAG: hypothetical protein ABJG15_18230 [Hyphomonadaceae bacterium]
MKIDRRVTLALIFAVLMQTAGALVWAGGAGERLSAVEHEIDERRDVAERLARLETELGSVLMQLDRIERKIDTE